MSFQKVVAAAKASKQTFQVEIPDGSGGYYTAYFRMLNGLEAMWTLRIQGTSETATSYQVQQDLRAAMASLIKFEDPGEATSVLWPCDILRVLYTKEQLQDPLVLLQTDADDKLRILYRGYLEEISRAKSEEEVNKLTPNVKEFLWELLLNGFVLSFDQEYLLLFIQKYLQGYRLVRPSVVDGQLVSVLQSLLAQAKVNEADTD